MFYFGCMGPQWNDQLCCAKNLAWSLVAGEVVIVASGSKPVVEMGVYHSAVVTSPLLIAYLP